MANPGVYPVDTTTDVGKLRVFIGDVESEPLSPPVAGQQDYTNYSDAQLQEFLNAGGSSIPRGAGYAYLALAGVVVSLDGEWTTDDLRVKDDLSGKYLNLAKLYFGMADNEDIALGNDYVDLVDTLGGGEFWPEATAFQYGLTYTIGRRGVC